MCSLVSLWKIKKSRSFLTHAVRQINQGDRRLLKGETIPLHEKVFSIFEPHSRWVSIGKAGCPDTVTDNFRVITTSQYKII